MAWCFSTRASVATVLSMHPCVSSCLWVKKYLFSAKIWVIFLWQKLYPKWIESKQCRLQKRSLTVPYGALDLGNHQHHKPLTHLPLDKMAAISADGIFKCIFLNENVRIFIQISLKFVPKGSIDNKPALVQVLVWRWTGDKPLPEPMLTQYINAYTRH